MTLTHPRRLLLVHAHPDDETLWTGGTIARYAAAGVHVTVVTCTLGEEGEIIPQGLAQLVAAEADQLGGYRITELRSACSALRVTEHRYLGGPGRWRDSGMVGTASNAHPRCLVMGDIDEQTAQLSAIIRELSPQVVISYDENGGYGHPDHIRAHQITMAASAENPDVARVFYAVHAKSRVEAGVRELATMPGLPYRLPEPGELPVTDDAVIDAQIDIAAHLPAKLSALRAHATQVSVWEGKDGAISYALSNNIALPVGEAESYVLARGDGTGADTDLFGGLDQP